MKIKKNIFATEIEFSIEELQGMMGLHPETLYGLVSWIHKTFGLNLFKESKRSK